MELMQDEVDSIDRSVTIVDTGSFKDLLWKSASPRWFYMFVLSNIQVTDTFYVSWFILEIKKRQKTLHLHNPDTKTEEIRKLVTDFTYEYGCKTLNYK